MNIIRQFLVAGFLFPSVFCVAQTSKTTIKKPVITPEVFGKFPLITGASLSNDGNYAAYSIYDPLGSTGGFYIKEIHSDWQSAKVAYGTFTNDNHYYIYLSSDSLAFFDLKNRTTEYVAGVVNYKLSGDRIAYLLKSVKKVIVRDFETKKEDVFENVNDYYFNQSATALLIVSFVNEDLQLVNLENQKSTIIWTANKDDKAGDLVFSKEDDLAFIVEAKGEKSIWYYKSGTGKAEELANMQSLSSNDLQIDGIDYRGFLPDGKNLFIKLKEKDEPKRQKGVDVWSFTDVKLQSVQSKQLVPAGHVGIVNIETKKITLIKDHMLSFNDDHILLVNTFGDGSPYDEWYWNKAVKSSISLLSLTSGKQTLIDDDLPSVVSYFLSPGGKYIVYYDADKRNYFSYEIATGVRRNLTSAIHAIWTSYVKSDLPIAKYMPINQDAGWVGKDEAILLYDQCDIYQVDLAGKFIPINLTKGLGKKQNIEFRLAIESNKVYDRDDKIIVSAFNRKNKSEGFYRIELSKEKNVELLTNGPYKFRGTWEDDRFGVVPPIKAKDAEVYLVRRTSAEESENYFSTDDFKNFRGVTNLHPEKAYNWLTTELIIWKLPDGTSSQGILYKPEDFDSNKKYPLIFYYYENSTEGLHGFLVPEVTKGMLNIPYYVSNGYLVFTPDIHYKTGWPGQSVVTRVVSAAKYLSGFSYVDSKHMGIQGHSRGGWETNFLVTHTTIFAAAMSSSGFCDYVSLYNGVRLMGSGISRQTSYEKVYQRIGSTLWQQPGLYIENSPIFKVDKVTTPLLMMNNKEDNDVPFEQGIEMFTALRRLGKRAWMLQYDGDKHMVWDNNATDLETRMKQFFDHYLKDSACPRWMLYGVPAAEKGNPDALKLVYEKDPKTGKWLTPKEGGLLTDEDKKKVDALKHRKPVTVTID